VTGNCAGPSLFPLGCGAGAETVSENDLLAVLFPASLTTTVKENCPVCVVEPLNSPVLLKENPCGNEPDATCHW
jgi:hypothetical protein